MKNNLLLTIFILLFTSTTFAQVAINTTGAVPASSAMLDVTSTNKGMRMPRMTSAQRKAIQNPDMGLLVYDTDRQTIYLFDGVEWKAMLVGSANKLPLISRSVQGAYEFGSFGESAAIYGNYAVIGAPTDSANGVFSGSVYLFVRENGVWSQQAKLSPSDGASGDKFGAAVEIYDDIIVVSAPEKAISGIAGKGKVYVFQRSVRVWNQVASLQASNGAQDDKFGSSVSTNGEHIVVGAPLAEFNGMPNVGCLYVFGLINNVWSQKAILHASDSHGYLHFGTSVSISGKTLVTGAPGAAVNSFVVGAVYLFNNTDMNGFTWIQKQKHTANSPESVSSEFGTSVSLSNNTLLVGGHHYAKANQFGVGAVWEYKFNSIEWVFAERTIGMEDKLYTGRSVVTDGINNMYSMTGWQNYKGRVALKSNSELRYFYHENVEAERIYGWAIDMHNSQIIITSKNVSLQNRNGEIFFGKID